MASFPRAPVSSDAVVTSDRQRLATLQPALVLRLRAEGRLDEAGTARLATVTVVLRRGEERLVGADA